ESKVVTKAEAAVGTLTSDNTNVANNATVTIGTTVYTFKTALTPADYEVLIGTAADDSLTNLAHAINGTGGVPGTEYQGPSANAFVTSGTVSSHAIVVTAISAGTAGNSIATTETSAHLSFGGTTLASGAGLTAGDLIGTSATGTADKKVAGTDTTEYAVG